VVKNERASDAAHELLTPAHDTVLMHYQRALAPGCNSYVCDRSTARLVQCSGPEEACLDDAVAYVRAWNRELRHIAHGKPRAAISREVQRFRDESLACMEEGPWALAEAHDVRSFAKATPSRGCAADGRREMEQSRSLSVIEAVRRLSLAPVEGRPFALLVAGADRCEGETPEAVATTFTPLCVWLAEDRGATEVHICLRGPNLRLSTTHNCRLSINTGATGETVPLFLSFDPRALPGDECADTSSCSATSREPPFDLLVAFNAGVWGYGDSWLVALAHASRILRLNAVVTAYCQTECEADEDAIQEAGLDLAWEAEANPFASVERWRPTSERGTQFPMDEEPRFESAWWLCVAPRIT
jgi:hypothetical protein